MQVVNLLYRTAESLRRQVTETETADGVNKAIQALIEVCAGNFNNQRAIVNAQVMDGINAVLRTTQQPIQPASQQAIHVSDNVYCKVWFINAYMPTYNGVALLHTFYCGRRSSP